MALKGDSKKLRKAYCYRKKGRNLLLIEITIKERSKDLKDHIKLGGRQNYSASCRFRSASEGKVN